MLGPAKRPSAMAARQMPEINSWTFSSSAVDPSILSGDKYPNQYEFVMQ